MSASNFIITRTVDDGLPADTKIITRGMMRERAVELAVIGGAEPHEVSKAQWEQAKSELVARHVGRPPQASIGQARHEK
jgi:hypothetical protein